MKKYGFTGKILLSLFTIIPVQAEALIPCEYKNNMVIKQPCSMSIAYIANEGPTVTSQGKALGSVSYCRLSNGLLLPCDSITSASFDAPKDVVVYSPGSKLSSNKLLTYYAYVLNSGDNTISICSVDTETGALIPSSCQMPSPIPAANFYNFTNGGLAIDEVNDILYITDAAQVVSCSILVDGSIDSCNANNPSYASDPPTAIRGRVSLLPDAGTLFFADHGTDQVFTCFYDEEDGSVFFCDSISGFSDPLSISLAPDGKTILVPQADNTVTSCPVFDTGEGIIIETDDCVANSELSFGFNNDVCNMFTSMRLSYVPNIEDDTVSQCPLQQAEDGAIIFGPCIVDDDLKSIEKLFFGPASFYLTSIGQK